jgi:hypothetical protein
VLKLARQILKDDRSAQMQIEMPDEQIQAQMKAVVEGPPVALARTRYSHRFRVREGSRLNAVPEDLCRFRMRS